MKKAVILFFTFLFVSNLAEAQKREIAVYTNPAEISNPESYKLLFRSSVTDNYKLRLGLSVFADTDKETRSDSLSLQAGRVAYTLSAGVQRQLDVTDIKNVSVYIGADGYYASEFKRESYETYYGYYWNLGFNPLVGATYKPFDRLQFSVEVLGDVNINLQEYSAPGTNEDARFDLRMVDRLGLSVGYLF